MPKRQKVKTMDFHKELAVLAVFQSMPRSCAKIVVEKALGLNKDEIERYIKFDLTWSYQVSGFIVRQCGHEFTVQTSLGQFDFDLFVRENNSDPFFQQKLFEAKENLMYGFCG